MAVSKLPVDELKEMEEGKKGGGTRWPAGFVHFFFVLSVILCAFVYAPRFFTSSMPMPSLHFFDVGTPETTKLSRPDHNSAGGVNATGIVLDNQVRSPCSSNTSICCDRSDFNTDVCFMSGDVRTDAASHSFILFPPTTTTVDGNEEEVQPYPRKWERHLMNSIQQVRLRVARPSDHHRCDVRHDAPAFVMTAGGYTGNLFHAFNDGFLPAWLTVQHLRRNVVLAVLDYNPWWSGTFKEIISGFTEHRVIDLLHDKRTHCFPGAIVGVRFHGILSVDPARTRDNRTIIDFHNFLATAYDTTTPTSEDQDMMKKKKKRARLGIYARKGNRVIENMAAVADLATSVGFDVDILDTATGKPLAAEYAAVSACDVLMGVHGADLTKLLFLRPGAALLQIAPLGVGPVARGCYAAAAEEMGLHYEQYDVAGHESSLIRKYAADDVVIADPEKAQQSRQGGWELVARVYLGGQNVSLDIGRFRETLTRLHSRAMLSFSSSPTPAA